MLGNDEELIINMVEDDFKDGFIRCLLFTVIPVEQYSNLDLELAVPAKQQYKQDIILEQSTPTNPVQLINTNKNNSRTGGHVMKW